MIQKQFVSKKNSIEYHREKITPEKIISIVSSAFNNGIFAVAEEIPSLLKYWESFAPTEEIAFVSSRALDPFEKRFFNNVQVSISKRERNYVWNGLCCALCTLKFLIDLEIKRPEAKKYREAALYSDDWEEKKKKLNAFTIDFNLCF